MTKILVVDDSEVEAELYKFILEGHGYEVFLCFSGKKAVERAKIFKPDLIISDFFMNDIDGINLAEDFINDEETKSIPIVISTAYPMFCVKNSFNGKEERNLPENVKDIIAKPFKLDNFVERVNKLVRNERLIGETNEK